jgi:imidazolonepropionase-like amidohydrolase
VRPRACGAIAVKAGRLIDPKAGTVAPNAVILVEGGRVKAVGTAVAIPEGAKVIDLSGLTVLPGLIDCHTHLVGDYVNDADPLTELKESAANRAFESIPNARVTLTPVHDGADVRARRRRDARRDREGLLSVRGCSSRARTSRSRRRRRDARSAPTSARRPPLRRRRRRDQVHQRATSRSTAWIHQILATGVLAHGRSPRGRVPYEEIRAAVEEAAHKGLVAAHAHSTEGIKNAIRAGASIEHGTYIDEGIRLMKERGTTSWPTSTTPSTSGRARRRHPTARDPAGDRLQQVPTRRAAAGAWSLFTYQRTRSGWNARQFALVRYGQTPMEAIRSATVSASDLIGRDNNAGSLEPGRFADLIAVRGDPLADVRALEDVAFVMKEGKVYKDVH